MLQKTAMAEQRAGSRDDFSISIAALPTNARQRKIALLAFIVLVIIVGANIPLAHMQWGHIHYFAPAIQTATCIANLLTAIFLFAQYSIYPQRALLALAGGFVFSGLFALLQMLAFPAGQSSAGLIGDELNSGPWLFTFWQTTFSLAVIVYALSKDAAEAAKRSGRLVAIDIGATTACVVMVTVALTWVATAGVGYLPPLHQSEMQRTAFAMDVSAFLALLNVTGLAVLFVRRRTLLDQWLLVTLAAWLPNLVMASFLSGMRYSEVWYVSRVYALFAGSALLFALLAETMGLHTRLTNAIVRLRRIERIERGLAAIVESSDDAIISEDLNAVIKTWNRGAERLFGYSAAEAVGKAITMLFPPGRQNEEVELLDRVCRGERVDRYETVRRRKDGSMLNVALSISPLLDESGTIVGASKIVRDITERKRAEERDALLRLAQASTGVGFYGWDVRTKELKVSPELEELFGLKPGSMKNYTDFRDRVHLDDIDCVEAHRDAVIQKPERFNHEFRIIRPNGETRWISSTGSALYDEITGKPIRILGSNFDITERKRAEERQKLLIAELDHRVKNILAQVDVVATSTSEGSRSVEEFLGSLHGRIQAMAVAHNLLSKAAWKSVGLDALVRNLLAPYTTGRNMMICGTDVVLSPAETQALARVLHELATNAAKYGSLSISSGQVLVSWNSKLKEAATNLTLVWRELGGPAVAPEHSSSYGTNLIRNLIPHELGGAVELAFGAKGVNCRIEFPISQP